MARRASGVARICASAMILIAANCGMASAASLPDGRAYEMVSPAAKNGGEVMGDSTRTRASAVTDAEHPMAVTFGSLAGFGDVLGSGIGVDYLSGRDAQPGTSGWSTHAITPRQDPLSFLGAFLGADPFYQGDVSDDLSAGVFRAWSPLTDAPDVQDVQNLYVRRDLRQSGGGSYELVTACPLCATTGPLVPTVPLRTPKFAGASADFTHLIFESKKQLTADASPDGPNLYEWNDGSTRLAAILPDGTPATSSTAGQGASSAHYTHAVHVMSTDGSRVFFTAPTTGGGFVNSQTGADASEIYRRNLGTQTTVQVSASERSVPDIALPATFQTASADGSRVLFTSSEALTNAPADSAIHLYLWNGSAPAGSRLTLLDVDHNAGDLPNDVAGVIGASDDGHYVYFIAAGQLVASGPVLLSDKGIYLWHDGQVSYIGEFVQPSDVPINLNFDFSFSPMQSRVTPGGKALLFASSSGVGLTGYDQSNGCAGLPCTELYVYSADTHHLACASCNPNGDPATANASNNVQQVGTGAALGTWHQSHALSSDGTRVFFSTAEALTPQDVNGKVDAYEYDVPDGLVHLISTGTDKSNSYFMDASPDGHDLFFITRQALVGWDTDKSYDLYDARVDGGFAEPSQPPSSCSGDSCQGSLSVAPPASVAGTTAVDARGKPTSASATKKAKPKPKAKKPKPKKCKRGLVRKKVRGKFRCQRPKSHAKKSKHAAARRIAS